MQLNFTWINLLILFGALQALIFTIVLLFQKRHPGHKFLAAFVFAFAYNGFETFNWSSGLDQHFLFFDMFGFIVIYLIGPSLYLYVCKLVDAEIYFSRKQIFLHYSIPLFQFVSRLGIIAYHILWINKIIISDVTSMQLVNIVWFYAEPLSVIVFVSYYVVTILKFKKYKQNHAAKLNTKEKQITSNWIMSLMISMGILAVAWPITVLAPDVFEVSFGSHYYPIELALVVFSYWIVFYGFHKVKMISSKLTTAARSNAVDDNKVAAYLSRLINCMEVEKLYLDPDLTIHKVSSHTGIHVKIISTVLNQHSQVNFNDFVNSYRVKDVRDRLINPDNQHLTISGMAIDAGFNSQATFQRVFKSTTGMTPREYMISHAAKTTHIA
ncbi:helix-turn-helix transcriptional regulator [Pseudochryseolinea flava]|uniref:HTH araC/xylS-type domain-containing protein n=1 Tax=Pseudochryseolinea flava TaxID=2059302 RepID=A0A364Y925_9BACT|nr:helix-turn-helix transcriptional regulator [Pseudochryseolinea flava]RAW02869.1 hypothetical protein DQQ10_01810 [Pseudochryseolinea flava]